MTDSPMELLQLYLEKLQEKEKLTEEIKIILEKLKIELDSTDADKLPYETYKRSDFPNIIPKVCLHCESYIRAQVTHIPLVCNCTLPYKVSAINNLYGEQSHSIS